MSSGRLFWALLCSAVAIRLKLIVSSDSWAGIEPGPQGKTEKETAAHRFEGHRRDLGEVGRRIRKSFKNFVVVEKFGRVFFDRLAFALKREILMQLTPPF